MPQKRGKNTIIFEILDICRKGAKKNHIVYQANMNYKTVMPYLDLLIKNNLIEVQNGSQVLYRTTDKGINVLRNLQMIESELGSLPTSPRDRAHYP
jgi:predicted transcriptional regulator